jgi:hypothetical protein
MTRRSKPNATPRSRADLCQRRQQPLVHRHDRLAAGGAGMQLLAQSGTLLIRVGQLVNPFASSMPFR